MPSRRAFLGLLAGAALDPERLLWTPGKTLYSFPPRPLVPRYTVGWDLGCAAPGSVVTIAGIYHLNGERMHFRVLGATMQSDGELLLALEREFTLKIPGKDLSLPPDVFRERYITPIDARVRHRG